MTNPSPCLTCGACCASFRVSFYWSELQEAGGVVPDQLAERVNLHQSCMKGTNQAAPHCVALLGTVGDQVRCAIYENRPSPCREFTCNSETPEYNEACDRARARYGLAPVPRFNFAPGQHHESPEFND